MRVILLAGLICFNSWATTEFAFQIIDKSGADWPVTVEGQSIYLTEFYEGQNPQIVFPEGKLPQDCRFAGKRCSKKSQSVTLNETVITYREKNQVKKVRLFKFPKDFPKYDVSGASRIDAPIILSLSPMDDSKTPVCHLMKLTGKLELSFYRRLPYFCIDFRPHFFNGKNYYSYQITLEGILDVGTNGKRVLLDDNFKVIKDFTISQDHHEFLVFGLDHTFAIGLKVGRLKSGPAYFDKRIQEVENGKVVFDWGVSDYFKAVNSEATVLTRLASYKDEVVADIIHMNSFQKIDEERLIIGMGFNGVVCLNMKERKIEWILGGMHDQFGLTMKQHPHFHHTPRFDPRDNTLTIFLNVSTSGHMKNSARIQRYKIDPIKKKLISLEVLRDKGEQAATLGSVQVIENTVSIGFGNRSKGDYDFLELYQGKEVAWLRFKQPELKAYRIYRRAWELDVLRNQ